MYSTSSRASRRQVCLEPSGSFRLAEDRLAELVEIQPHARPAPLLDVAAQVFLLAGQDHVLRLVAQPSDDGRNDQARQIVRHRPAQQERDPLPPVHVLRYPVALEQVGELVGDALGAVAAEGLVGQRDGELLAVRIGHHAGELAGLGALVGSLLRTCLAQERFGQLDGAMGEAHPRLLALSVRRARPGLSVRLGGGACLRRPGESARRQASTMKASAGSSRWTISPGVSGTDVGSVTKTRTRCPSSSRAVTSVWAPW